MAFSPDGQLVVTASRDGAEQVWHAGSGELQSQFNPRHSSILAVEFDRTSKLLLAAGVDGTVVVADAALGMPITVLEGPQNAVGVAHFDPSLRRVVGASWDGTARVWDSTAPYRRWTSQLMSDDCGLGITSEPDRRFIAIGCRNHPTRVWDTAHDQLLAELPSVSHVDGDFTSASPAVSAAGDRAAIARGNAVEVYEFAGRRLLRTIAHSAPVNAVAFATNSRDLVSGAIDGSLLVARDNGALLALPISAGGIDAAAFLPDGRVVASDAQRRLRVYDPGGAVLADLELPGRVMSLRIDGTRLVTIPIYPGGAAPPVLVDLERYRVITQLVGHVGLVFSARWVAGGRIITAGADGTARLWDGSTGQLRQIYRGSSRFLADATLAPDDLVMASTRTVITLHIVVCQAPDCRRVVLLCPLCDIARSRYYEAECARHGRRARQRDAASPRACTAARRHTARAAARQRDAGRRYQQRRGRRTHARHQIRDRIRKIVTHQLAPDRGIRCAAGLARP